MLWVLSFDVQVTWYEFAVEKNEVDMSSFDIFHRFRDVYITSLSLRIIYRVLSIFLLMDLWKVGYDIATRNWHDLNWRVNRQQVITGWADLDACTRQYLRADVFKRFFWKPDFFWA